MVLSREEADAIIAKRIDEEAKKQAELQKEKADYKIQIWFTSDRRLHDLCSYTISFWESSRPMISQVWNARLRMHEMQSSVIFTSVLVLFLGKPETADCITASRPMR